MRCLSVSDWDILSRSFVPEGDLSLRVGWEGVICLSLRDLVSKNGILRNLSLTRIESLYLSLRRLRSCGNTPKLPLRRPDFYQIYYLTTI